ncbi:MAG: sugar phosphate isomerase/epimerase [Planctomycetaceae bacterium]|nr:sugar phosphate isomerase/epimerase [Planctomycetaceae bacterium]
MWTSFLWDIPIEDALREQAAAGWMFAELSDEHSIELIQRGRGSGEALRKVADDLGVSVEQGHLDLPADIASTDAIDNMMASIKRRIDLFAEAGITAAVIHPGGGRISDPHERLKRQLDGLHELTVHAQGTGVVMCLEPCCSGWELAPLLRATAPAQVGVCLDSGHVNLTAEDQADLIRSWGPRLRGLHISDNDGKTDLHIFPRQPRGTVKWWPLIAALEEIGYAGLYNFELPGENRVSLDERRAKLRTFITAAREMFGR